jgi:Lon protease-like protein
MEETTNISALPSTLPLFPLPGATLLPRCSLPLNIFEPRYLKMVGDVSVSHKLIGMIQPLSGSLEGDKPDLFLIGCAGRIEHIQKTDDGRIELMLRGISRFTIEAELQTTTPYRQALVNYHKFEDDLQTPEHKCNIDRSFLLKSLSNYLDKRGLNANYEGIEGAPDEVLVNTLSMIIPFLPAEKQALIESDTVYSRCEMLLSLLEMASANYSSSTDNERH